jgi:hypothetical protein
MGGVAEEPQPDLSAAGVDARVRSTSAQLHDIVKKFLVDKPDLHEIVDQIAAQGATRSSCSAEKVPSGSIPKPSGRRSKSSCERMVRARRSWFATPGRACQTAAVHAVSTRSMNDPLFTDRLACPAQLFRH